MIKLNVTSITDRQCDALITKAGLVPAPALRALVLSAYHLGLNAEVMKVRHKPETPKSKTSE